MLKTLKHSIRMNPLLDRLFRLAIASVPYNLRRKDSEFNRFYIVLKNLSLKSKSEIEAYQFVQLKNLVTSAYENSEFYKSKFDLAGFHPSHLSSLRDLPKIPVLTREEIRENGKRLVLKTYPADKLFIGNTSGTTGKALTLYYDKKTDSRERAAIFFQWSRLGFKSGDGKVEFRGLVPDDKDFFYYPDENVLRINILKLSSHNIEKVITEIRKSGYRFYHGYPSAIYKFVSLLDSNHNLRPDAILLASEILFNWQMELIDKIFTCPKISHFGQSEKVVLASWNEKRSYFCLPAYGITELDPITHEIIGTGFINEAMPLIRYKLTDIASLALEDSQNFFPVFSEIQGRLEDITYNADGEVVPPAIVTFPFKNLNYISNAKIIQRQIGKIELILETTFHKEDEILQKDIVQVVDGLKIIYGKRTIFEIKTTKLIPASPSGKFRWIECELK